MAQNPETQALLEQALKHLLSEQAKVLQHTQSHLFIEAVRVLGDLAAKTWDLLAKGYHKIDETSHLTRQAIKCEELIDDISEANWIPMEVSVSAIFERVEQSFSIRPIEQKLNLGAAIQVRNHFHNLKVTMLGQLLGARMLINANDYGSELQRVWQDFLQRQLGPGFRVLEGGHIMDHKGNNANAQIDLIIVQDDAQVLVPSDLSDGKINVLCDQVIAAIMVTSNLSPEKLCDDWVKLERVSALFSFTDEFPHSKEQAWPLCYIVAGQSVELKKLKETWAKLVEQSSESKFVPQFVVTLDSGYIWSGATAWPRPRYPGNYVERSQIVTESGIHTGLGLAWMITQIRGRARLLKGESTHPIQRFKKLLEDGTLKAAVPPTWSKRFDISFTTGQLSGVVHWGHVHRWGHNRLHLIALERRLPGLELLTEVQLFKPGTDLSNITWKNDQNYLRWFHHGAAKVDGSLVAVEEWIQLDGEPCCTRSFAVFNAHSGDELQIGECESLDAALMKAKRLRNKSAAAEIQV